MEEPLIAIDHRVLKQWRLESLALTGPLGIAGLVLAVLVVPATTGMRVAVGIAMGVAVLVAVIAAGQALVGLRYRHWRYRLDDDALILQHGVWIRRLSMTPYFRVQNVDVAAGPLERWLGLKRLTIHTASASSDASIPGLDADDADELRRRILARAGRDAAV